MVDAAAVARAPTEGTIGAPRLDAYENEPDVWLSCSPFDPSFPSHRLGDALADLAARNALAVLAGDEPSIG